MKNKQHIPLTGKSPLLRTPIIGGADRGPKGRPMLDKMAPKVMMVTLPPSPAAGYPLGQFQLHIHLEGSKLLLCASPHIDRSKSFDNMATLLEQGAAAIRAKGEGSLLPKGVIEVPDIPVPQPLQSQQPEQ